jgi:hypothetical protein
LYSVLKDVLAFQGGQIDPLSSSDPLRAIALRLRRGGARLQLVANLTAHPQIVRVAGSPSLVALLPYGVARLNG